MAYSTPLSRGLAFVHGKTSNFQDLHTTEEEEAEVEAEEEGEEQAIEEEKDEEDRRGRK